MKTYHVCNDYSLEYDPSIKLSGKKVKRTVVNRIGREIECTIHSVDGEVVFLSTEDEKPKLDGVYIKAGYKAKIKQLGNQFVVCIPKGVKVRKVIK